MSLRSPAVLWGLLLLQAACTVFFVADALFDALGWMEGAFARVHQSFEYLMTLALVTGVVMTALSLRAVSRRQAELARQVAVASGAFEDVLRAHFDDWGLTPSEADVARLAIKGFSVAEMAAMRGSKEGTIKAQSAAVYRKAGVTGRLQLISLFVEELMSEPPLAAAAR